MNNVMSTKGFELHKLLIQMYQDTSVVADRNIFLRDNIVKYINIKYPSLLLSYKEIDNDRICIHMNTASLNNPSIKDIILTLRTVFANCIEHLFDIYPDYKNKYMKLTRIDEIEFKNEISYLSFYACNILTLTGVDKDLTIFVMDFIN